MFKLPRQKVIVHSYDSSLTRLMILWWHRERIWACDPPFLMDYFSQIHGFLNKLNVPIPPEIAHGTPSHLWPFAVVAMILRITSEG